MKYRVKVTNTESNREWRLLEEFKILGGLTVPEGFVFDGASIPVGLRWIFPHGGRKFGPACAHDYLYRTGILSKERADRIFYDMMIENGISLLRASALFYGVKYFGRISWMLRRSQDDREKIQPGSLR